MIEITVRDHLKSLLPFPVYLERPKVRPDKYAVIENTGGTESNFILLATIVIHTYGASMYEAAEMAWGVKHAMDKITEKDNVSACRVQTAPMNWTDTTTKNYRYRAVYQLIYMED